MPNLEWVGDDCFKRVLGKVLIYLVQSAKGQRILHKSAASLTDVTLGTGANESGRGQGCCFASLQRLKHSEEQSEVQS